MKCMEYKLCSPQLPTSLNINNIIVTVKLHIVLLFNNHLVKAWHAFEAAAPVSVPQKPLVPPQLKVSPASPCTLELKLKF